MRKVYKDLILVVVCVILVWKFTLLTLIAIAALAAVWFFVLDEKKKKEITDKIKSVYNR